MAQARLWASTAAGLLFTIIGIREWRYYDNHPYAHGVSEELVGIAAAGILIAFAVGRQAYEEHRERKAELNRIWANHRRESGAD